MIGQNISHYKILEKLGEGGMGVVYKAEDTKLKRIVALKFLPPELTRDPEAKERFIHEAQAASALDHPNICTIYEIGETDEGQLFIAMACCEGETLKKKIERGPLKIDDTNDVALQVAQGLRKAHEKGIVHRDIKPTNIIVTTDGVVKIVDFGLAKLVRQTRVTKAGTTVGTVAYMSPEQARGEEVDHRTDIWSIGIVLYEMLTGLRPFRSEYDQALVYSILNEEPEPLKSLRPDVPTELEQVVEKALHKDLGKRVQQIGELVSALNSLKKKREMEGDKTHPEPKGVLPSIAVIPFVNMSADPENEYFSDGLAEELINALSKLEGLHVVARTSAFRFRGKDIDIREIGKQLNVNTILEGSVRKAGNRLRITAQLIKVADGYHLWSERFDRELQDVFAIQDEISLAIVDNLKVKLLGGDRERLAKRYKDNFEVYDLYLKGRYYLNTITEEGIKKSLDYFQQAIQKDPSCALAYAGTAGAYGVLAVLGLAASGEVIPRAKSELLKALELDDYLAEAHAWLGEINLGYYWDWSAAEKELKRAIELKPNSINSTRTT
jgi:serine/threonine protein kinase